jgi:hypothetical protein
MRILPILIIAIMLAILAMNLPSKHKQAELVKLSEYEIVTDGAGAFKWRHSYSGYLSNGTFDTKAKAEKDVAEHVEYINRNESIKAKNWVKAE